MTSGRHYYRRKAGCFLRYKCFRGVDVTSPGEEAVDPDRMASSAYMGVLEGMVTNMVSRLHSSVFCVVPGILDTFMVLQFAYPLHSVMKAYNGLV